MTLFDKVLLVAAAAVYLAVGGWLGGELPIYHEEVAAWPNAASRIVGWDVVLEPDEVGLPLQERCGEDDGPAWVTSSDRPRLIVCAGETGLPLMTTSYASSVFTWPLFFVTEPFARRKAGLVFGLLALSLSWLVVVRLRGHRFASISVFCIATTPWFVGLHAAGFSYETMLWLPGLGACALALSPRLERFGGLRLTGASVLLGLAVLASVKALFLLGPLLLVAWRQGSLKVERRHLKPVLIGFALPLSPIVFLSFISPDDGAGREIVDRLMLISSNLTVERVINEPLNLLTFWSDLVHYAYLAAGQQTGVSVIGLLVSGTAALWVLACAVRFLWTGSGHALEAFCGIALVAYLAVSVLLYDQYPATSYCQLGPVFGLSIAALISAITSRFGQRTWVAAGLVVLFSAPYVHSSFAHGSLRDQLHFSKNTQAVASLAEALDGLDDPTLLTTSYNMAGVLDAFGEGRYQPIQVHDYLLFNGDEIPEDTRPPTIEGRWRNLLERLPGSVLVVVNVHVVPVDDAQLVDIVPALEGAASLLGRPVEIVGSFATGDGTEVLQLLRVASASATP